MIGVLSYGIFFLTVGSIYAVSTLGLNLQWGFTGILSAGIVGFFGIGAYAQAFLTGPAYADALGGFGLPFPVGLLGALAASGAVALIVGMPMLRLRHDFLAIGTFGLATCIQLLIMNLKSITRGFDGLYGIPRPLARIAGSSIAGNALYLGVTLLVLAVAYRAMERMLRSPWGRVLRGIREDEEAAGALGKAAVVFRLQAFVIGSMLMGLSGALYAGFMGFISPQDILPIYTFQVFVMLIVGGSGNNRGALLGTLVIWGLWTLSEVLLGAILPAPLQPQAAPLRVVLVGLVLVVILLVRPEGLLPEEAMVSAEARLAGTDRQPDATR